MERIRTWIRIRNKMSLILNTAKYILKKQLIDENKYKIFNTDLRVDPCVGVQQRLQHLKQKLSSDGLDESSGF
jgi:hypothetical protein